MEDKKLISIGEFKNIEIKIGEIKQAEKIENSDKLLKLSVDFGEESHRQILSGISAYFSNPETLIGRKCAFVTNLEPRKMMGLVSEGMILAVGGGEDNFFSTLTVGDDVPPGATVK